MRTHQQPYGGGCLLGYDAVAEHPQRAGAGRIKGGVDDLAVGQSHQPFDERRR